MGWVVHIDVRKRGKEKRRTQYFDQKTAMNEITWEIYVQIRR
jgi:hypothetical protein